MSEMIPEVKLSDVEEPIDVRDKILTHLKKDERSFRWLCRQLKWNYHTLYSCFILKTYNLSDERLQMVNALLRTDFKK